MEIVFDKVLPSVSADKIVDSSCSSEFKIMSTSFFIDVHQNASLSDSFQGGRSRVIGDRCKQITRAGAVTAKRNREAWREYVWQIEGNGNVEI